jgi:hypothetical protein
MVNNPLILGGFPNRDLAREGKMFMVSGEQLG